MFRAPTFWLRPSGLWAFLLAPLSWVWKAVSSYKRRHASPVRVAVPVISVGNLTVGGTGKTPIVQAIIGRLRVRGINVHVISRGYGGRLPRMAGADAIRVDPARHSSDDVGDEPLLLADAAPTWVARNRAAAAQAAIQSGAQALVLDDGHQNLHLAIDLALVVVDGETGFGNGRIVPAGPLREPVAQGLARADLVVMMGGPAIADPRLIATFGNIPQIRARLAPIGAEGLAGCRALAFAGIGRPEKFFDTLREANLDLVGTRAFPDHYPYSGVEITKLLVEAEAKGAMLVTTHKDWIRLEAPWRPQVATVMVQAVFDDAAILDQALDRLWPVQKQL